MTRSKSENVPFHWHRDPVFWGIFCIAFFLRFYQLGKADFWYDEVHSIMLLQEDITGGSDVKASMDFFSRAAYLAPLRALAWVFPGYDEGLLRSYSVLWGVLALPLLYEVAVAIYNRGVARIASLLLAVSLFHVLWSRTLRCYSLQTALVLLCVLCFVRWLQTRRTMYVRVLIYSGVLIAFSNVVGLVIFGVFDLFLACHRKQQSPRPRVRPFIVAQGILVVFLTLAALVWFVSGVAGKHFIVAGSQEVLSLQSMLRILLSGGENIGHGGMGFPIAEERASIPRALPVVYLTVVVLAAMCWLRGLKHRKETGQIGDTSLTALLFYWCLGSTLFFWGVSFVLPKVFIPRYLLFTVPAFCLAAAVCLWALPRFLRYSLFGILVGGHAYAITNLYKLADEKSWESIARYVSEKKSVGEAILFFPVENANPFLFYFRHDRALAPRWPLLSAYMGPFGETVFAFPVEGARGNEPDLVVQQPGACWKLSNIEGNAVIGLPCEGNSPLGSESSLLLHLRANKAERGFQAAQRSQLEETLIDSGFLNVLKTCSGFWLVYAPDWVGGSQDHIVAAMLEGRRLVDEQFFPVEGVKVLHVQDF